MFLASQSSGATVISVAGDLDRFDQTAFATLLRMADHAPKIVIDLTRCHYLDSGAISTLARQHRNGPPLVLVVRSRSILARLLEIVGLADALTIVEDLDHALAVAG